MNDSYFTVDDLELSLISLDRGSLVFDDKRAPPKNYNRYAWHETGISPRRLPGQSKAVLYADSDEHTEAGHITENADVRKRMMAKRMQKLEGIRTEITMPEIYPSNKSDNVLVGWGSIYGAMKEAVDLLKSEDIRAQMIHFSEIFPFTGRPL